MLISVYKSRLLLGSSCNFKYQIASHIIPHFSCNFYSSSCQKVEKLKRVMSFLSSHGFTDTQITKVIKANPKILVLNTQKTLLPKIQFLSSIGISNMDIPRIITHTPWLLTRSLEKKLVPAYNALKNLLCGNEEDVVKSIKRDGNILVRVIMGNVARNVEFLRGVGLPQACISFMLMSFPYVAYQSPVKLKRCVEDIVNMGFVPSQIKYILAVNVKCGLSKSTWERRMMIYRSWGLSDQEILLGFGKHPAMMYIADENIARTMDVYVNKMGYEAVTIARNPYVLFFNLERRIIPRCRVIKVLMLKGLVKTTSKPSCFMIPSEEEFLDRYVRKYEDDLPELDKVYVAGY